MEKSKRYKLQRTVGPHSDKLIVGTQALNIQRKPKPAAFENLD
jgi:hypothetical protein